MYTLSKSNPAFVSVISLIILLLINTPAFASGLCGNVFNVGIGPWDYSDPKHHRPKRVDKGTGYVQLVEKRHFTKKVEELRGGQSNAYGPFPDIAYTLGKFPNHHRALLSLVKLDKKLNGKLPPGDKPFVQNVECYFKRAFDFRPNDEKTWQVYGIYFHLNGNYQKALEKYHRAEKLQPSSELYYNIGLSYFEIKDYEKAKKYADLAYNANFPLQGLRGKLARVGIQVD